MKASLTLGVVLLLGGLSSAAAQKCPSIELQMLDKGFSEFAPWRVLSGGPVECSFMTKNTSINLGFNHLVTKSPGDAVSAAKEMMQTVAPTSMVEPMLSLGEKGFTYQPKAPNGQIDRASMFFYGHRGSVNVSGYLNLTEAITPAQRELAGNLIASTLGIASNPKALAKVTNCRYLDPEILRRLLPGDDFAMIVPDANNCIASAGGKVVTLAIAKDTRGWPAAERSLKSGGCTVDALPKTGKGAGIAHHCGTGNPRAEVMVVTGSRVFRILYAPAAEPSDDERAALVELARGAIAK